MRIKIGHLVTLLRVVALFAGITAVSLAQESATAGRPTDDELLTYCLREEGNIELGRSLFTSDRLACAQCHSMDGSRGKLGPDLSAVGDKLGRREIVQSVMFPSAVIADGYEQTLVQTTSGEITVGVIKSVSQDWLELVRSNGTIVRVRHTDIDERATLPISAMPHNVQESLIKSELNDLVEYLVSLKQPESSVRLAQGMPRDIQKLHRPVELTPILPDSHKFEQPVWMVPVPGTQADYLVVEHQVKKVWYLELGADPASCRKSVFLDIGPGIPSEGRLACLAFHPNFLSNHKYYLYDRDTTGGSIDVVIQERTATADGRHDSGNSPRDILRVPQSTLVHFGGWLAFGPDEQLYVSCGDSGPQEDPQGNAQNRSLMLGKILRIDVTHATADTPYVVPADNPFVGQGGMPAEVWALGFRAPWRCSFDRETGELWVGDVGQDRYEEVSVVQRGENHGWNVYEGFAPFSTQYRRESETYVPPVFAYPRRYGPSVTGGYVYRANSMSSFHGKYICGDFESRRLFAIAHSKGALDDCREIGLSPQRIVSFAEGQAGEIFVVGYEGMIYRVDFSSSRFE